MSKNGGVVESLGQLADAANRYQVVDALADELRARRDFLVIACYRAGVPVRQIAKAAGVHYSRVQQLTRDAADAAEGQGLRPAIRAPKKAR